jgi:hypothetical protein
VLGRLKYILLNYCCNLSALEVEMATAKLKGVDQIPAELIEAGIEQYFLRSRRDP